MSLIFIDFEGLNDSYNSLNNLISELENEQSRLEQMVDTMSATWTGASSEAFIVMLGEQIKKSQKLIEVLRKYSSYVSSAKDKFDNLDRNLTAIIRSAIGG